MKPRVAPTGRSRKISVSVTADDLRVLSARANRLHGGNLSAVIHDIAATLRREEAADRVLRALGGDEVSGAEMEAIRDEVRAPEGGKRLPKSGGARTTVA